MAAIQSILVPIDGSTPSLAALDHAIAVAEDTGATITILHVDVDEEFRVGSTSPLAARQREELDDALEQAIRGAQIDLGDRARRLDIIGDQLRTILETAGAGPYDLIVMGTHGRSGRLRSMLGSVAEGIVRNAPCPVLTVRETSQGYQSFAERRHGRPTVAEQAEHRPH
ncbi:MAG: universal stress protein [Kofleriaceae bacterium]|nr:universal stress protein [Kofleriaceae bacterium]